MDLLWPGFLVLLGLIPLLLAIYLWMLRRRRRFAVRYSSLSLVRAALPQQSRLRRHLPFAFFLLGLVSLAIALARPVTTVMVPIGQTSIILAMDVSLSMCAVDIRPNRLQAAKDAAKSFIQRQPASSQIGIVAFAGFAALVQPATNDQEMLQDAIENLTPARRTAIGSALLESLDAIAEVNQNVAPTVREPEAGVQPTTVPDGVYAPDIIVLLTDGASNSGPYPLDAAQQAADRGVRVYTIGYGTENGSVMDCGYGPFWFGGGQGFGGNSPGNRYRPAIDEPTLKQIAALTGGTYYSASSAGELRNVFQELPTSLITRDETMEISVAFVAMGALLATAAVILSLIWHPLP